MKNKAYLPLVLALLVLLPQTEQLLFSQQVTTSVEKAEAKPAVLGVRRLADYDLPGLTNKVSLESTLTWDVVQLVEFLTQQAGLRNVVISKGVAGSTKLRFEGVTAGEALEVVLSVNNLAYEMKNGILTIMTDDEYKALYGVSFYDHKKVKIVELRFADPDRVGKMLAAVKSAIGTVVPDPVTGTLILIDTPDKIVEMQEIVARADLSTVSRVVPTEMRTFVLQYANVEDILTQVTAILTKEVGAVRADKRTKTLIVSDLPHNMLKIEQMIKLFDKIPRQVFIEAKVVETTLSDDFSMGINWQHLFQGLDPRFSLQTVSQPGLPTPAALSLNFNTITSGGDLQAVLNALKSIGSTRILSNPHIAVLDGQEASIEVVEDQPYKEIQLESGTTNITGVTYQFKKVGISLAVTPRINDQGFVHMAVKPEISSITQWYDGAPQQGTPVVQKSLAETTVIVKDGVTIIIGGMIKDQKDKNTTSVPILGSIPLLGRLFRSDTINTVNTETIVFLTPRIISGEEPYLLMKDMKKVPKTLRSGGSGDVGAGGKEFKPIR